MAEKNFRVSSALKDIIGKDLITNEFIAVFELVKNAFDAHATKVDVTFRDLKTSSPTLIIQDNGKGMDAQDFEDKWLFVAYSAKKDGTEDYRDSIKSTRIYAGAKGIGRFSCDRLGRSLRIFSRKKNDDSPTNLLSVNWEDFEKDPQSEFKNVAVTFETVKDTPYKIAKGTVLEISSLRQNWDRDRLLKLRRSLEKLVNPNQDNDSVNFAINLFAPDYEDNDDLVKKDEPWEKVNGPVENFLFEKLGLKSTFINVKISEDGSIIETRLEDRGTLIFKLEERNPYIYDEFTLSDIEVSLFALNRAAKIAFTRYMGTQPVNFGSVFVYKNGFRINPMGDPGHDSFRLDRRKTQGTSRFLGSRDVVGRIEINGLNPEFQEASSRDGGLVANEAYNVLQAFFLDHVLKRLEGYAVDIIKYGNLGVDFDSALQKDSDLKSKILALVRKLTNSDEILDIQYDPDVVDIFEELSENSVQGLLRNFKKIAVRSSSKEVESEILRAEARLAQLDEARREAEEEAKQSEKARRKAEEDAKRQQERTRKAEEEAEQAKQQTEKTTSENLFLRTMVNNDVAEIKSLHHHIGIAASTIDNYIKGFSNRIRKGQSFTQETVLEVLENISLQARKILSTTRFATKANFVLEGSTVTADLCEYIAEYLINVCEGVIKTHRKEDMRFVWSNEKNRQFLTKFRPLEISIILDNLISNSRKANANSIRVVVLESDDNALELQFSDDGKGVTNSSKSRLFELGFTTTSGSGLGLAQTKKILDEMNGDISLDQNFDQKGAAFILRFSK